MRVRVGALVAGLVLLPLVVEPAAAVEAGAGGAGARSAGAADTTAARGPGGGRAVRALEAGAPVLLAASGTLFWRAFLDRDAASPAVGTAPAPPTIGGVPGSEAGKWVPAPWYPGAPPGFEAGDSGELEPMGTDPVVQYRDDLPVSDVRLEESDLPRLPGAPELPGTVTPEPGSLLLVATGLLALRARRRRA